jgi:hypothetical protein
MGDALADPDASPAHIRKLRGREKALLDEHGEQWAAEAVAARSPKANHQWFRFERGFLAHFHITGSEEAPRRLIDVLAVAPTIDSVELDSISRGFVNELFACPAFTKLRALRMPVFGALGLVGMRGGKLADLSLVSGAEIEPVRRLIEWPELSRLVALEVSGPKLTPDDAIQLVAGCGPMRELQLRSSRVGPAGAAAIAGAKPLANLEILSLMGSGIGPAGTQAIAQLGSLRALDLRKNKIGVPGAKALAAHRSLRALDLTGNTLGAAGLEALCRGDGLGELRELCLQQTLLDDAAIEILADSELLGRLTSLSLRSNKLTDAGAKTLAKAAVAKNLRSLNLNNNEIGEVGRAALQKSAHLEGARISLR